MKRLIFISLLIFAAGLLFIPAEAALINSTKEAEISNNTSAVATKGAGYDNRTAEEIMSSIIRLLTSVLGTIFIVLIFYAGFQWMTANGKEEKIKKAKDIIFSLIIGLCVLLITYSFSAWLAGILGKLLLTK